MSKDISTLPKEQQLPQMLAMFKSEVKRALPAHLSADRICRIALTAFRQNPTLAKCDPASVFAAVIQSSQLGLEVGINGQSFLVPYYDKTAKMYICAFIPGWKGLVDLVNRTGRATVWTAAVYDGDEFDWGLGDKPFIHHKPLGFSEEITHYYAVGRVNKADWPNIEVWRPDRIERHRDTWNKVGDRHYSYANFEMYARKVVLLQVLKYMPSSAEMSAAVALSDAAEMGNQKLNINDAVDGTWAPAVDGEESAPQKNQAYENLKAKVQTLTLEQLEPEQLMKSIDFGGLSEDETKVIKFDITDRRRTLKKAVVTDAATTETATTAEPEKPAQSESAKTAENVNQSGEDKTDWVQMLTDAEDDGALAAIMNSIPEHKMVDTVDGILSAELLTRCCAALNKVKQEQFADDFDFARSALASKSG